MILVVNPEVSERTETRRAAQTRRRAGAHVVGAVVNSVSRQGAYECEGEG